MWEALGITYGIVGLGFALVWLMYCFKMFKGSTPRHYHPKSDDDDYDYSCEVD